MFEDWVRGRDRGRGFSDGSAHSVGWVVGSRMFGAVASCCQCRELREDWSRGGDWGSHHGYAEASRRGGSARGRMWRSVESGLPLQASSCEDQDRGRGRGGVCGHVQAWRVCENADGRVWGAA
eukprot:1066272-Rhodomonas_salina.1